MAMLSDLRFWDERLEACFEHELAATRHSVVSGFSLFRLGILIFVTVKTVIEKQCWSTKMLFAAGIVCSLLPYFGVRCRNRKYFRAWQWAALLTDVVQATIGCFNHMYMAPSGEGISPLASLVYLLYGSTALWMLCYTSFSHLPFWMELVKAATISVVLLAFNDRLCRDSPGLRRAYGVIHHLVQVVLRHRPMSGALWPAAAHADLAQQPGGSGGGGSTATWICTQYQMHVVLLAFVATTWTVHRTERRMRLQMLYRCTQPSIAAQSSSRHELAGAATAALEEEAASGSAVSDMDFFLGFGIPAALGILMVFALDF